MEFISKFENAKNVMNTCINSQLVLESRKQHIKLAPKYIGNIRKGVHMQLAALLLHPDKSQDGIPVAYNNVRVIQNTGKIISDQTCVHLDIQADFILFKPAVGCRLEGKVNKVAKRHIGCLVHNNFNAWIPHTSGTEKIAADFLLGSEIEFTIQDISTHRNVLSIKGKFEKFLSENLQKKVSTVVMQPVKLKKKNDDVSDKTTHLNNNSNTLDSEGMQSPTTKKRKKHKKDDVEQSLNGTVNSQNETETSEIGNDEVDEHNEKTKKEKHKTNKRKSTGMSESVLNDSGQINDSIASLVACEPLFTSTQVDDFNNNSTGKVKEKKRKKKKSHDREDTLDTESSLNACMGNDTSVGGEDNLADISLRGIDDSQSVHEKGKSRKRRIEENLFTNLKDSVNVNDTDLAGPSPMKKHKKKEIETLNFNSSVDFEENASTKNKEKKKKKHKEKLY